MILYLPNLLCRLRVKFCIKINIYMRCLHNLKRKYMIKIDQFMSSLNWINSLNMADLAVGHIFNNVTFNNCSKISWIFKWFNVKENISAGKCHSLLVFCFEYIVVLAITCCTLTICQLVRILLFLFYKRRNWDLRRSFPRLHS